MPVMTTGGIARKSVAQQVLDSGVSVAGIATALVEVPDLPLQWKAGNELYVLPKPVAWKNQMMAALARMALVKRRLRALGNGRTRSRRYSPLFTLITDQLRTKRMTRRYRKWLQQQV
ncbi:hypothetical protein ACUNE3_13155 [Serratia sp. IR-2025]